ncbi:hypothetical protein QR685DRAFT_541085 [Neurospora intermedia]|uniref:Uncharacterized protein n=1 Tax=Neurospora intermedia TaxID=5142 RepID=A0ABR3DVC7_NEUIN
MASSDNSGVVKSGRRAIAALDQCWMFTVQAKVTTLSFNGFSFSELLWSGAGLHVVEGKSGCGSCPFGQPIAIHHAEALSHKHQTSLQLLNSFSGDLYPHQSVSQSVSQLRQANMERYFAKRPVADPKRNIQSVNQDLHKLRSGLNNHSKALKKVAVSNADDRFIKATAAEMARLKTKCDEATQETKTLQERSKELDSLTCLEPDDWEYLVDRNDDAVLDEIVERTCTWLASLKGTRHDNLVAQHTRNILDVERNTSGQSRNARNRARNEPEVIKDTIVVATRTMPARDPFDHLSHISQTQYDQGSERITLLEKELEAVKQELKTSQQDNKMLQEQLDAKSNTINEYKDEEFKRTDRESKQLAKLLQLTNKNEELTTSNKELRTKNQRLQENLETKTMNINELRKQIGDLETRNRGLEVDLASAPAQQRSLFEQNTRIALRIFLLDIAQYDDDAPLFDPILPSLNTFNAYYTEEPAEPFWNLFSTSGEYLPDMEHRPLGTIDFVRDILNLFAILAQLGEWGDVHLIDALRPLVYEVTTRECLTGEVVYIVYEKANDRLATIDPVLEQDPDTQILDIQLYQFLKITAKRWRSLDIPYN